MADDAEHNPVAAGRVGEAGHRPGPAPHFAEGALDHIWWCALSSSEPAGTAKKLSSSSKSRSTESKRVSLLLRPGARISSQNEAIKQLSAYLSLELPKWFPLETQRRFEAFRLNQQVKSIDGSRDEKIGVQEGVNCAPLTVIDSYCHTAQFLGGFQKEPVIISVAENCTALKAEFLAVFALLNVVIGGV